MTGMATVPVQRETDRAVITLLKRARHVRKQDSKGSGQANGENQESKHGWNKIIHDSGHKAERGTREIPSGKRHHETRLLGTQRAGAATTAEAVGHPTEPIDTTSGSQPVACSIPVTTQVWCGEERKHTPLSAGPVSVKSAVNAELPPCVAMHSTASARRI